VNGLKNEKNLTSPALFITLLLLLTIKTFIRPFFISLTHTASFNFFRDFPFIEWTWN
jgi:hypothetical protein